MKEKSASRIMVLDDDRIVTRSIEQLLVAEGPHEVKTFNCPQEALASLETTEYQVVVTDFLMPEMDGIKVLKRVKEMQLMASRIMLTGYADKQNAIRSINEVGLYHYIEKPWDNEAVLLVLRNAAERSRLLKQLDSNMRELSERNGEFEELRARLLKALV